MNTPPINRLLVYIRGDNSYRFNKPNTLIFHFHFLFLSINILNYKKRFKATIYELNSIFYNIYSRVEHDSRWRALGGDGRLVLDLKRKNVNN